MPGINVRYDPDDLVSFHVIDTGVFPADGQLRSQRWKNPWGKVKIVGTRLALWADFGVRADMYCQIVREADGVLMHKLGWDHYGDPPIPRQMETQWYAPYGWYLYPGDYLLFEWYAADIGGAATGVQMDGYIVLPAGPIP